MKHSNKAFGIVMAACLSYLPCSISHASSITGISYDSQSLAIRYIEEHRYNPQEKTGTVTYHSPDKELLAHKTLSYAESDICPSFRIVLNDNKRTLGITRKENTTLLFTTTKNGTRQQKVIPDKIINQETLVCDAGFDIFVRDYLLDKTRVEKQRFFFALPNHLDYLEMHIHETDAETVPDTALALIEKRCTQCRQEDLRYFIIEPGNWLYRQLTDPITLVYHQQRLLLFSGRSNIASRNNNIDDVIIVYQHDRPEVFAAVTRARPNAD